MIRNLLRNMLILFIASVAGFAALMTVSLIPNHLVSKNLQDSVETFEREGYRPEITPYISSKLDNFTDALMLETAAQEIDENIVNKSLLSYRYVGMQDGKELDPVETFIAYYGKKDNIEFEESTYARYWHGYLVFLKPVLVMFHYSQMRMVNTILHLVLTAIVFLKIKAEINIRTAILYVLMWASLMPVVLFCSLQFSSVFYITTIATIVLLTGKLKKQENALCFFLVVGCLTSYFDLLTYPLITLGIPLIIYLSLYESDDVKENIKLTLLISVTWAMGYFGMWVCKWIMATLLTDKNIISSTLQQIQMRSSNVVDEQKISFFAVLAKNMIIFLKNPAPWIGIAYCVYPLFQEGLHTKKKGIHFSMLLIAAYPFFWYLITMNHSYIHAWFTYRELSVSLMALGCMIHPTS